MKPPARIALLALAASTPLVSRADVAVGAGTFTTTFNATTAGETYVLAAGDTREIVSGATVLVTFGGATGPFNLTVDGTLRQTGTGRAVRGATNNVVYNITTGSAGLIQAVGDDAIQARAGTFNITNNGTIYSGSNLGGSPSSPIATGQALDLVSATGGTVINSSTGILRADGHDAVRLGNNMTFTNHGTVLGNSVVNDSSANNAFNTAPANTSIAENFSTAEGVSFEGGANSSLDNYGSISGSRHGVESAEGATNVTITNRATGSIIGRNGSGIGFDAIGTSTSNVVIHNHGLVRGDYAGAGNIIDRTGLASATNDGDGDGIDIDGAATINNHATGQILSTGAGGFDTSGRANNSEAVAFGGGVIVNDGLIRGAGRGILVNNDTNANRSGVSATSITNNADGTIEGQTGFAIRLENKLGDARDNDTIINAGTIIGNGAIPDPDSVVTTQNGAVDANSTGTLDGVAYAGTGSARFIRGDGSAIQTGEGADVLTNTGTITGNSGRAVNMEGGDDTVNFNAGTITGSINGGAGTDTLALGAGVSNASAVQNFETIRVSTGRAVLSGVVSGSALSKTGAGVLALSGANTFTGGVTVSAGTLEVSNTTGSGTGSGDVQVDAGARLTGGGIVAGNVTLDGVFAAGSDGIGTFTVDGDVTWNGSAGNAWEFELGGAGLSDDLIVGGDFLKGAGGDFVFDFLGGGSIGTYVLVDWAGLTTFSAGDFSYTGLGGGLTGTFVINGSRLEFVSAIPEPSSAAALAAAGALGLATLRRRRRA